MTSYLPMIRVALPMCLAALTFMPHGGAFAQTLQTRDGLAIGFDQDGKIASLETGGKKWPITRDVPSGLLLRDVAAGGAFVRAGGTLADRGDSLVQSGRNVELNLDFEATYRATDHAIQVSGFIHDASGQDRAITVRVALPVDATNGVWWQDINEQKKIGGELHSNLRRVGVGANGSASMYPWAAVSTAAGQICLGIPMDRFVVHRFEYDAAAKMFYADFDFGLSPLTKAFPSRADFSLVIYTSDSQWGFRSAAAKYYAIFAEDFRRLAEKEGLWMPFTDIAKVQDPEDFNFIFQEGASNVPYDDAHGIYSFVYVSPHWAWLWMPDRKDKPTPEYVKQKLEEDLRSDKAEVRKRAELIVNCSAKDAEGNYHYRVGQAHWAPSNFGPVGWYAMHPANADPDLEKLGKGPTTGAETMATVERLLAKHNRPGSFLDGFYLDGVDERPLDNYAREQFQFAEAPLTFGTDTKRPILCGAFSSYKFLKRLSERVHSTGRLLMANGIPSQFPFAARFLDAGGSELEPPIENDPVTVPWLAFARSLLHHKPLLLLYKPRLEERFDRDLSPYLIDYMNTCLLYAAEPSLFKIFSNTNHEFYYSFFERPDWYNKYRPIFIEYVPLVKMLGLAGWEPVTCARSDDGRVMVERFGAGANANLVLYNAEHGGENRRIGLDVQLDALGWPKGEKAWIANLSDGSLLPTTATDGGLKTNIALPPRRAAVLALRPALSKLAELDLGEAARYIGIACDRIAAKLDQKLPVDFESDPDGDGCPDGFRPYEHPPGSADYASDDKVFHSAPRSTRIVLHGKARGTLSARLPAQAGRKYVVSVWAKADFPTPGSAHVYVQWLDKGNKSFQNEPNKTDIKATQDWALLTQEMTSPEKAEGLSLIMVGTRQGEGDATVWFDDPKVIEVGPEKETTLLPMQPKGIPASAKDMLAKLRGMAAPIQALLASAQKGSDAGALCRESLGRASEIAQQAEALRQDSPDYANVAAALDTCAGRLRRAANLLVGWRMTLSGDATVAKGESPQFMLELIGGSLPVTNLTFKIDAPQGWDARVSGPSPASLPAHGTASVILQLTAQAETQPQGALRVAVSGETEGGHRIALERQTSFEITPACLSSLLEQGQEDGGRVYRLLLTVRNVRKKTPLAIKIGVSPPRGFTAEWAEKSAQVKADGQLALPIALTSAEHEKTRWCEAAVSVSWNGATQVHRRAFLCVPPSANLLGNGGMEQGGEGLAASWNKYDKGGYTVDTGIKHSGLRSIRAVGEGKAGRAGACQTVTLNQKVPRALVLRGWSLYQKPGGDAEEIKTIGMTELGGIGDGERSPNYSLYVDLHYVGGGALYGQAAAFDKSIKGWQFSQRIISVPRPVQDAAVYLLFRNHEGTAWFDDVTLTEADPNLALAKGTQVVTDSTFNGYTPKPLIDGVVDTTSVDWAQAAWASADGKGEHWAEIILPEAVPVKTVVIHWAADSGQVWTSRNYSVQVFVDGAWRDVAAVQGAATADFSVHSFDPVTTNRVRIIQPEGGGPGKRPLIMWLREIELF